MPVAPIPAREPRFVESPTTTESWLRYLASVELVPGSSVEVVRSADALYCTPARALPSETDRKMNASTTASPKRSISNPIITEAARA